LGEILSRKADIVVPAFADVSATRACIESVFQCTGAALGQLIVVNDCSPDAGMTPMLHELQALHPEMVLISNETNLGFVRSANRGMGLRQRDVVLLNSDTLVTPGWLSEMLEVAYAHDGVAAVVPLSNNAAICSVPAYCQATEMRELIDRDLELEALPRFTAVPTGVGFCLLLKNIVLNMIGGFDPAYGRGYHEENDWAMRAQTLGFVVLRANRALVYHLGAVSFGVEREKLDRTNSNLLLERYPYFLEEVRTFSDRAEARIAASYVRRRMGSTSVCISFRHLDSSKVQGADVYPLELAKNLKEHAQLEVVGLVKTPEQERHLADLGVSSTDGHREREQIFHHPAPIFKPDDLRLFLSAAGHAVITFPDLHAWRTPSAHPSIEQYERYQSMSFAALHSAQAVIAVSNYNRDEIIREFHLPSERVHVIHVGVDAAAFQQRSEDDNRSRLDALGVRKPYFLYVGTDDAHKNVKLLLNGYAVFRSRFAGGADAVPRLILAGAPSRSLGSIYDSDEPWPTGVSYLGALDAPEVHALHQGAVAFLFPSAYEGFAFPVLEAMAAGAPIICSSRTSIPEVAGDAALYIKDFSPEEIAQLMIKVTGSPNVRRSLIREGHKQVKRFTWQETARKTVELYQETIVNPATVSLFQRSMFWNFVKTGIAPVNSGLKSGTKARPSQFSSLFDRLKQAV
jgi:glycosyltransferase involved in cell wall biosynthesis